MASELEQEDWPGEYDWENLELAMNSLSEEDIQWARDHGFGEQDDDAAQSQFYQHSHDDNNDDDDNDSDNDKDDDNNNDPNPSHSNTNGLSSSTLTPTQTTNPPSHIPTTPKPSRTRSNFNAARGLQTLNPNGQPPQQDIAPPLLPAFLITGLLLGAIVLIIIWRHFTERRRSALIRSRLAAEEDDAWAGGLGINGMGGGVDGTSANRLEKPIIWEVYPSLGAVEGETGGGSGGSDSKWEGWESVMPLSVTPFFGPPKRQQPRYLIPSDRPTTFMTRMFGGAMEGYRFGSRDPVLGSTSGSSGRAWTTTNNITIGMGGPALSTVAYTNRQASVGGQENDRELAISKGMVVPAEAEEKIEKVQVAFVIAMPEEHAVDDGNGSASKETERDGNDNFKSSLKMVALPVMSSRRDEGRLPELCLGSLMIPYG